MSRAHRDELERRMRLKVTTDGEEKVTYTKAELAELEQMFREQSFIAGILVAIGCSIAIGCVVLTGIFHGR